MANQQETEQITRENANDLRLGSYIILSDERRPCKILDIKKSKPGKHGSAKIRIIAVDVFTNKKREDIFGSQESVDVPIVSKEDLLIDSITPDGFVKLLPVTKQVAHPSTPALVVERPLSRKEQRKMRQKNALEDDDATELTATSDAPSDAPSAPTAVLAAAPAVDPARVLKLPGDEELKEAIIENYNNRGIHLAIATILRAMGQEAIVASRIKKEKEK